MEINPFCIPVLLLLINLFCINVQIYNKQLLTVKTQSGDNYNTIQAEVWARLNSGWGSKTVVLSKFNFTNWHFIVWKRLNLDLAKTWFSFTFHFQLSSNFQSSYNFQLSSNFQISSNFQLSSNFQFSLKLDPTYNLVPPSNLVPT